MKYPNLRYGNPQELAYHARGIPIRELAKRLRRSERSVLNWLAGTHKMPFWVPELVRLQNREQDEIRRQMGFTTLPKSLGIVTRTAIVYNIVPKMVSTRQTSETDSADQNAALCR